MTRTKAGSSEPAWDAGAGTSVVQDVHNLGKVSGDQGQHACDAAAAQLQQLRLEAACRKVPHTLHEVVRHHKQRQQQQQSLLSSCDMAGVAHYILSGRARNIVVMAGAGISVSAGIPDFRTPGSGLYSQLQRFQLPWPEAVFDIRFFRHNPKPFYLLAKELFPGGYCPTPAHFFIRLLHDKGLLLRAFTQNIDGLEQLAGLPSDKVVPAHGSFDGAHCIDCGRACSVYAVQQAVYDDEVATCESCGGLVKPDVVFFGEALPVRFHRRRLADMAQADLLIVMGTSLVVQPFASMVGAVPADCPRLLINMTKVGVKLQQQQQQQEQEQEQPLLQHKLQQTSGCSSGSSTTSSTTSSTGDASGDDVEGASCGGSEGNAAGLTASSSCSDIDGDDVAAGADADADAAGGNSADANAASIAAAEPAGRGFDFDSGCRDVLSLGDCDAGVARLAELLGWQGQLLQLLQQGREAFEAARLDVEGA